MFNMKWLAVLALVLVLAAAAYGFAAANTVVSSGAGEGIGNISGYSINEVKYSVNKGNGTNDSTVAKVSFTASAKVSDAPPADHAAVKFTNEDGSITDMTDCTLASGTWTCTLSNVKVKDVSKLTVLAWYGDVAP